MKIEFIENIPENHSEPPILISGEASIDFNGKQFLSLTKENGRFTIYEIRYEYHGSPFKQAEILNNILVVGHDEYCYLFDIGTKRQLKVLRLSGYFGHIYLEDEFIYVADAYGIYCLSKNGTKLWSNNELGTDGVIINDFCDAEIYGIGEWDPPGGWEDFIIDKKTGKKLEKTKC
jgi:hypothetical protein